MILVARTGLSSCGRKVPGTRISFKHCQKLMKKGNKKEKGNEHIKAFSFAICFKHCLCFKETSSNKVPVLLGPTLNFVCSSI